MILDELVKLNKLQLARIWVKLNCHVWPDELTKPSWYGKSIKGVTERDMFQRRHVLHTMVMHEIEILVSRSIIKHVWRNKIMFFR